jgi:hypothetical protein
MQCHTLLTTIAVINILGSNRIMFLALSSLLNIAWLFENFYGSYEFWDSFFFYLCTKNAIGIFIGIVLNLQIALGSTGILHY